MGAAKKRLASAAFEVLDPASDCLLNLLLFQPMETSLMQKSCSVALTFAAMLASTLSIAAKDKHNWIMGSLVNISSTQGSGSGAAYVYTIHEGNREFVIRSETVRTANSPFGERGSVGPSMNVGESITFAPEGAQAWILSEGVEYQCRVLRQKLLKIPSTGTPGVSPQESKSQTQDEKAGGEPNTPAKSGEERPTIEVPPAPAVTANTAPAEGTVRVSGSRAAATTTATATAKTGASPTVYQVGGGVSAPALLYRVDPEYTEEARKAGLEGTVILYAEVGTDGYARNIRVTRRLGLGLDEKAVEAVRKWKFRPGFKDAKPVVVVSNTEVNFRLPHEPAPENPLASGNSAANPLMLQGSASYLRQRLHFWELKDAKAELGRVVGHPRNLGPETFTFVDPTRRYRVFDLTFDTQTKKLVEIRVHPWGGLRWNECKAIWGSNYSQSTTEEPGVLAYSYRTRPITALVRRSGEVVSFDFH